MDPQAAIDPTVQIADAQTVASEGEAPPPPSLEARLVGHFAILRKLGEGGMGTVYVAYDERLERRVALKLLHGGDNARLVREAQALARLSDPNVVQIYEVGEFEGRVFVAMEYVEGPTLSAWLAAEAHTAEEIIEVFVQAGRGLAAAHERGLVHRDFKPGNVLVGIDDRVRVLDFGLARAGDAIGRTGPIGHVEPHGGADASLLTSPLTRTGALLGTPAYMSPEQHVGGPIDARSDQFSFCAALFEALHGARPFAGESLPELAANVIAGRLSPPPPRADVAPAIDAAIRRGLAPGPEARWPAMEPLLEVLASGRAQVAALDEGRVRRMLGGFVIATGVAALVAVQFVSERPYEASTGQMTAFAVVFAALASPAAWLALRRFSAPRQRAMIQVALVMVLASLAVRLVLWLADQSALASVLAESVTYASVLAAAAVSLPAPWVMLAALVELAGPFLVLALGWSPLVIPPLWIVSVPVAMFGLRRSQPPALAAGPRPRPGSLTRGLVTTGGRSSGSRTGL